MYSITLLGGKQGSSIICDTIIIRKKTILSNKFRKGEIQIGNSLTFRWYQQQTKI
jgi:hypothetical protein